jgi:hypothetical protein
MKKTDWKQIEKDFIEWDNEGHSNASQRQILNWFEKRFSQKFKKLEQELQNLKNKRDG